jgi:sulfate/thiosulfate transport system substrate-binding protein
VRRLISLPAIAGIIAVLALGAAGCGGASDTATGSDTSSGSTKLALVAYSTPQEAFEKLIEAFRKTDAGKDVGFSKSFGASGDQSRAVEAGQPADIVEFSLEPDITRLVKAKLVAPDWNADEHKGVLTDSVVVFAVRKGNPKGIHDWSDLLKPGVEVVTANPFTSGGARWNLMAAYGAQIKAGRSFAEAVAYLRTLITKHVQVQDKSARESLATFSGGKGDVLLAYENEAITAQRKGIKLDYVVPDSTILIEYPVAITAKTKHPEQAKAFVDYLRSDAGQRVFGEAGYRPVVESVASQFDFPKPRALFTIADLGGWDRVMARFFDPEKGEVAKIEEAAGVSTSK